MLNRHRDHHRQIARSKGATLLMPLKADTNGANPALCMTGGSNSEELTYTELFERSKALSDYFIEQGIRQGERIAILSESRPRWGLAFFASVNAGAAVVPLDMALTEAELTAILLNVKPAILIVSASLEKTGEALLRSVPSLRQAYLLDGPDKGINFLSIDKLKASDAKDPRERASDETAVITYTSGTTGKPKGIMITFGNLIFQIQSTKKTMNLTSADVCLSILPLNHLLELAGGFLSILHAGGQICYCNTLYPQEIAQTMRQKKVTCMVTVPLFLKMLKEAIEREVRKAGFLRKWFFDLSLKFAARIPFRTFKKALFYPVHKQFGGKLKYFVCGGAPLEMEVARFFDRLGIPIYQGYGLTETSPVISVNSSKHNRMGSVGRPLPGVSVKVQKNDSGEEEGEILTKGPHVMKGYYRREDLNREVIDGDGWLHTGDIGRIDNEGYLYITGRTKNLIVLGGGKKVQPEEVELVLSHGSMIKESCVIGVQSKQGLLQATEEVCAVIVPSEELTEKYAERQGAIEEKLKKEIQNRTQTLAPYKRPSKVVIRFEDLPKTSTRKIKRYVVEQWIDTQECLIC